MFFANFITTPMKAWAADWVTRFPLHFTLACIARITDPSSCLHTHVHNGVHGEMYIGIDSHLIVLSLCCIICSQTKD